MQKRILRSVLCSILLAAGPAWSGTALLAQSPQTRHTLSLDDGNVSPPASIEDVSWLTGRWAGEGLGGQVEEMWGQASGGSMVGAFKLMQEGRPTMYELELIVEEEGSLVWKVRHFGDDFTAWEERSDYVSFPLVKIEERAAYFDGLSVVPIGPDSLHVYLAMPRRDRVEEAVFTFRKVR